MQTDRQTDILFFYIIFILYVQDLILNEQDNILFIPDRKQLKTKNKTEIKCPYSSFVYSIL